MDFCCLQKQTDLPFIPTLSLLTLLTNKLASNPDFNILSLHYRYKTICFACILMWCIARWTALWVFLHWSWFLPHLATFWNLFKVWMPLILLQEYPKLRITLLKMSPRISTGTNYENKSEVTLKEKKIQNNCW